MRLTEILEILKSQHIPFELKIPEVDHLELDFQPASLKNKIRRGLYFIENSSGWNDQLPAQSVVITDAFISSDAIQLKVAHPQMTHYRLLQSLHKNSIPGIHPTAIVSPDAEIHSSVSIGPYCVLGRCTLSEGVELKSHVVIEDRVHIGARTRIDAHSAIGVPGMAWIWSQEGERIMQPQLGGVVIEEDCLLASDISVVCGSLSENTRIGKGTVIAHGSKIGHGAQIEEYVHMANNVSLAGNAVIGHHSFLGSASVISSNITLPAHSIVGAGAVVNKNFTESYLTLAGVPAQIIRKNNYEEKPRGVPKPFKNNS